MGVEQRSGGLNLDRLLPWGRRAVQEPTIPPPVSQNRTVSVEQTLEPSGEREERRPSKRERREFFTLGGLIREADLGKNSKDIEAVQTLYAQDSVIEHFSHDLEDPKDDHPISTAQEIWDYYKRNPGAKLLVAELAGEIVGAITIAPEKGLNSTKLNRLVRRDDKPSLGIAHFLIGEAIIRSFLKKPRGYQAASITIGVILDVHGSDAAHKAFKQWKFETQDERDEGRCTGWSKEQSKMVSRDVEVMKLKRRDFTQKYGYGWYLSRGTINPTKREKASS